MSQREKHQPDTVETNLAPLWTEVERIGLGMVVTHDAGTPRARPMLASVDRKQRALYFFTRAEDHKVEEVSEDQRACVTFVDSTEKIYISVSGRAAILEDRDKAREHWSFASIAWFDDGVDDEDLRLLKISVEQAEKWEADTSLLRTVWEIALSYRTEKTPDLNDDMKFRPGSQ